VGRITLAGTPATIVSGGTSRVTTAPAPTIAPSPMWTPGTTVTDAPNHTRRPITIGAVEVTYIVFDTPEQARPLRDAVRAHETRNWSLRAWGGR